MNKLQNYKPLDKNIWSGRIDDPEDIDSYRWHQLVELIDLSDNSLKPLLENLTGFCILGYCCDKGVEKNLGRSGAAKGPYNIRKELANLPRSYDDNVKIFDAGNITCNTVAMEDAQFELSIMINKIFSLNLMPIVLGGGHDVAFGHYMGIINYFSNKNGRTGIINFDAHFDLRPYNNGANSGTMFSQIADMCSEKERDFSYFCVGIQKTANTVSLFKKAEQLGAGYILEKDINEPALHDIKKQIDEFISKNDQIYLTLCSDVFSAAYAPGVSASQPFGMHPEMVLLLLKHITNSGKVISFDIAEVSPRFDEDNRTAKLAAITIFAVINTIIEQK